MRNHKDILVRARLRFLLKSRNFKYKQPANINAARLEISSSERRLVTIVFADIVKSSELVRRLDPEVAQDTFNALLREQIAITQRYDGTVNQVLGDGIMCIFGAEAPHGDHALRATLAGLEMVQATKNFNRKHPRKKELIARN